MNTIMLTVAWLAAVGPQPARLSRSSLFASVCEAHAKTTREPWGEMPRAVEWPRDVPGRCSDGTLRVSGHLPADDYGKGARELSCHTRTATGAFIKNGRWFTFWRDGTAASEREYYYDVEMSAWRAWYRDGSVWMEQAFHAGVPHGRFREWSDSGVLLFDVEYWDGARHGSWRAWDTSGTPLCAGEYRAGDKHGRWQYWDEDGRPVTTEVWRAGHLES